MKLWTVLIGWSRQLNFRFIDTSKKLIFRKFRRIEVFEEMSFSKNRSFRRIEFFGESNFSNYWIFRRIEVFRETSSSKNQVFRRIEFFEESNFFKNLYFRRIDKTFLWMFVFFHFLPILQDGNIRSFKFIPKIWFFCSSFWRLTILIFLQFYIVTWSFWRMKIIYLRITSKNFIN